MACPSLSPFPFRSLRRRLGALLIGALFLAPSPATASVQDDDLSEAAVAFVDELLAIALPSSEMAAAISKTFGFGTDGAIATVRELGGETGLGSARAGEGLIGLRRAFHHAGARTVIASLWSVEDDATSRLMRSFHEALWNDGLSRSQALRRAQLDLLDANRREHGEPRPWTWGAFVLSGDWL